MYYNSLNQTQPELALSWAKTENQKAIVKKIFSCNLKGLTAYEAWKIFQSHGFDCPLTSIRRSITDLTTEGYLIMTADKRTGGYGAMNFIYKVK